MTNEEIARRIKVLWEKYIPLPEVNKEKQGKGEKE